MKVALCQMNIIWEDKEKNLEKVNKFCKEASESGADVIFFPEMSCTGFTMNTDYSAEPEDDLFTINKVKQIAIDNGIDVGIGWVKKKTNSLKCENHYSIIDINGEMISDYIKIHPFSYSNENNYFDGGNEIVHYTLGDDNIPCSTFICYDLRFPEIFQIASRKAHCIVVPANWPKKRAEHWKALVKARAIENQVYLIAINCVGNIGDLEYSGDSMVVSGEGEVLSYAANEECIIYSELDDVIIGLRESFPVKNDRKVLFYKTNMV